MNNRKKRTRQHIIADLSTNYVERFALLAGFSTERVEKDYGYDLIMFTYNQDGEIETGHIYIQIKATDNITSTEGKIKFPLKIKDIDLWQHEPLPVILILYDAKNDVAYWLYIQAYFEKHLVTNQTKTIMVCLDVDNKLSVKSIQAFQKFKQSVIDQLTGKITHHE